MQFFSADFLERIAHRCGFVQRMRVMLPLHLVLSLLSALSKGNGRAIADLHRQFNGMGLDSSVNMAYKTFHNFEVVDLICQRGHYKFRVIRRWFAEEKRFCLLLTNLSQATYSANDVMAIYRCRWQIELMFKELKSHTHWQRFATSQKAIVEGLVWASLLALILRRSIATRFMRMVPLFKAAKNVDIWLLPILEALLHRAWSEIAPRWVWAKQYILKNAVKSQQRKSIKNKMLDGIFSSLNA